MGACRVTRAEIALAKRIAKHLDATVRAATGLRVLVDVDILATCARLLAALGRPSSSSPEAPDV